MEEKERNCERRIILFFSLFNINIIVNGKENETIEYGDTYTEEGASAS